jgi:hypothetical protein
MANHLAVATVTEALRQRITQAVDAAVPGTQVVTKRPDSAGVPPESQVAVFLYRVTPNAALRNDDLPTRGSDGVLRRRPRAAIDLHYLLSFSGDESALVPQRLLGSTLAALHARATLSRDEIRLAISVETWLQSSNLADEVEQVKFTMATISLDELSKIWSVFFQTPYMLSVAYEANVVLLEEELTPREPLRVGRPGVGAIPAPQPQLEQIRAVGAGAGTIVGAEQLELLGQRLRGADARLRFDAAEPQPVTPDRDTRIAVPPELTAALAAGIHTVQVVHAANLGDPPTAHQVIESNALPFVLRPRVAAVTPVDRALGLAVRFTPAVRPGQKVRLLLNELVADRDPRFYSLEPAEQDDASPQDELRFPLAAVTAGAYLLRAQVDGAESPTELRPSPDNPAEQRPEPQVVIP